MSVKSAFRELKSRLSLFKVESVSAADRTIDFNLSEEDLERDLIEHRGTDRLLERFSQQDVVEALKNYGVWKLLSEKGYPNPRLIIRSVDPFRQMVKIIDAPDSPEDDDHLLCELRIFDAHLKGPCPTTGEMFDVDALVIDWLVFQNPKAAFSSERPRLPGQKYPGLGIMRPCMQAILELAKQTGKEAVINIPEYYHNAVLYQPAFRFFSPFVEGRFLSLQKFLGHLSLAEASHAVTSGKIWNAAKNEDFVWKPHEQILGLNRRINDYFQSEVYLSKVEESKIQGSWRLKS